MEVLVNNQNEHKTFIIIGIVFFVVVLSVVLIILYFVFKKSSKTQICNSDSDCTNVDNQYCDTTTNLCTACPIGNQTTCPDGCSSVCSIINSNNCTTNLDCINGDNQYCDTTTNLCTACPIGNQKTCPDGCSVVCTVDLNVCATDSDCSDQVNEYCNTSTKQCTACPIGNQDYCPNYCSSICKTIDIGDNCVNSTDCSSNQYCDTATNTCQRCLCGASCHPECKSCLICQGDTPYCYPPNASNQSLVGTCSATCNPVSNISVDLSKYDAKTNNKYDVLFDWPVSNDDVQDISVMLNALYQYGESDYHLTQIQAGENRDSIKNGITRVTLSYPSTKALTPLMSPGHTKNIEVGAFQGREWKLKETGGPCSDTTPSKFSFIYCQDDSDCVATTDTCDLSTHTCTCGSSPNVICNWQQLCKQGKCTTK